MSLRDALFEDHRPLDLPLRGDDADAGLHVLKHLVLEDIVGKNFLLRDNAHNCWPPANFEEFLRATIKFYNDGG
jgi:hypothetical protein